MKKLFLLMIVGTLSLSCAATNLARQNPENELRPEKNEEGEWDLTVIDSQYDYFMSAIAKPINMYSESFLRSRNMQLVTEWNSYFYSGRYRNIIESSIQYDPQENYGKQFDYKLYQVFVFVRWKYGLRLSGISKSEWVR